MSNETKPDTPSTNAGYERQDIGAAGILYFFAGLAIAGLLVHFLVTGLYSFLEKRSEMQQPALSPLVTNAPVDTRKLPADYKTDSSSTDYEKYLQKNFPAPQLETNERNELNKDRLREEQTLSTYDYLDKNAGTVRIPIDRAMDLIAQRGLPTRNQSDDELRGLKPIDDPKIHVVIHTRPQEKGQKK